MLTSTAQFTSASMALAGIVWQFSYVSQVEAFFLRVAGYKPRVNRRGIGGNAGVGGASGCRSGAGAEGSNVCGGVCWVVVMSVSRTCKKCIEKYTKMLDALFH